MQPTTTTTAPPPAPPRRDSREIRRALAKFIGYGYIAYFVIVVIQICLDTTPTVPPWWTPLALTIVFLPGWAMLASSFSTRTTKFTIEVLPLYCAFGYLVAIGSWFPVWTGQHSASSTGTWLVTFPGLAALALVVTPRPWASLAHLAVALPAVQIANAQSRSDQYGQLLITDIAWGMAFSALFVLAGLMAVHTGDQLDKTYASTLRLAAESASQRARETQRKIYGRLIHDRVLAVMRQAQRANADPAVGEDARRTLHGWAGLADERSSTELIAPADVLDRLREALSMARPALGLTVIDDDPNPERPPMVQMRVGAALADATGEAVRNARRHAGAAAAIAVTARLDCLPLLVTIDDDGPGFDPSAIAPTALGLTDSIAGLMSDVGGDARIYSAPGTGTSIELRWPR